MDIDFLPERIRAQRARWRRRKRQACLLLLCALGLTAMGYARHVRVARAQTELESLAGRGSNLKCQLEARTSLERQLADLMLKKRIDEHLGSRVDALDVLVELGRLLPESMALRDLNLEALETRVADSSARYGSARAGAAEGGKPKETTEKRIRLTLTGLAPSDVDVANFIGQLSGSPLFEDVNMGYAKNVAFRGRAAREFQASCYVVR